MTLNRDFGDEQESGVCSYCGQALRVSEAPDGTLVYETCPSCDEYDEWGWVEDEDFGFEDPCHDWEVLWDDGVGQRCCLCTICGEEAIFQYDSESEAQS